MGLHGCNSVGFGTAKLVIRTKVQILTVTEPLSRYDLYLAPEYRTV